MVKEKGNSTGMLRNRPSKYIRAIFGWDKLGVITADQDEHQCKHNSQRNI
jgi:hypothetical protein